MKPQWSVWWGGLGGAHLGQAELKATYFSFDVLSTVQRKSLVMSTLSYHHILSSSFVDASRVCKVMGVWEFILEIYYKIYYRIHFICITRCSRDAVCEHSTLWDCQLVVSAFPNVKVYKHTFVSDRDKFIWWDCHPTGWRFGFSSVGI